VRGWEADDESSTEQFDSDVEGIVHPGLQAGVALAGANRDSEPVNEGLLTALEAAELDLHDARLVVLSACQTGLGQSAQGEGLLGLQRAFLVAGARATVTSLWQVPDQATRALMVRFYENLWQGPAVSPAAALREAQTWLAQKSAADPIVRAQLELPNDLLPTEPLPPFYWAAFVLAGTME
jgi:CHAT domain-containing protein